MSGMGRERREVEERKHNDACIQALKRGKFNIALLANDLMKIHDGKRLGHLQLTNAWTSKQAAWL
jgi:hypothetical protein